MSHAHRRAIVDKQHHNAAVPVALLAPTDPPRDDDAGAVPQHPAAAGADRGVGSDRGVLEALELDDRRAPVGMLPTDPAWMRLLESLASYRRRWWRIIFGIAVLVVVMVAAAATGVMTIGTLVPGGRWVVAGGASVIAGATTGGVKLYRRRRRQPPTAHRSRHGKGTR